MSGEHLVFYDGQCGLCDQVVQFLLRVDEEEKFLFAPLQGETAQEILKGLPEKFKQLDTVVLVEKYDQQDRRYLVLGHAGFRILWILGGWWSLLGWISFLPPILYNWGYRLVAANRKRLFPMVCVVPKEEDKHRFLP